MRIVEFLRGQFAYEHPYCLGPMIPSGRIHYCKKISEDFVNNGFFKSLANNLTDRYDEIGVGSSDRSFFARKIERYFSGEMLHFFALQAG